jgi:hypothetical protein
MYPPPSHIMGISMIINTFPVWGNDIVFHFQKFRSTDFIYSYGSLLHKFEGGSSFP